MSNDNGTTDESQSTDSYSIAGPDEASLAASEFDFEPIDRPPEARPRDRDERRVPIRVESPRVGPDAPTDPEWWAGYYRALSDVMDAYPEVARSMAGDDDG